MAKYKCWHRRPGVRRTRALLVLARLQQPEATEVWSVALGTVRMACPTCKAPVGVFCKNAYSGHPERITQHALRFYAMRYNESGGPDNHWPNCELAGGATWIGFDGETHDPS